jgi:hypothetical protein
MVPQRCTHRRLLHHPRGQPLGNADSWIGKDDVTAPATGKLFRSFWHRSKLGRQLIQRFVSAVSGINIERQNPRYLSGRNSNVGCADSKMDVTGSRSAHRMHESCSRRSANKGGARSRSPGIGLNFGIRHL